MTANEYTTMTFVPENSKSFVLKYMSVQRKYTKSCKEKEKKQNKKTKQQTFISTGVWCFPPVVALYTALHGAQV